jgi:SAM-dependent methyltransferase
MKRDKEIFEKVYEKPGAVWTETEPPKELIELIESGRIKPCKVIDIGCGEGFYSIYLASRGFDVVGIDLSENAIKHAKENSEKHGVNIRFLAMDIIGLGELKEKFDFVFEWTLLHQIIPSSRQKYVENVSNILNKGGKYLSVCFNEQDPKITGPGKKIRIIPENSRGPTGGKLYFSSLDELKELFDPHFKIIESKIIKIFRGGKSHIINYLFMEKEWL